MQISRVNMQEQVMGVIDKGDVEELERLLSDIDVDNNSRELLLKLIGMKGSSSNCERG